MAGSLSQGFDSKPGFFGSRVHRAVWVGHLRSPGSPARNNASDQRMQPACGRKGHEAPIFIAASALSAWLSSQKHQKTDAKGNGL
jgi:hypothetical protein